jgi:hypothetical protein
MGIEQWNIELWVNPNGSCYIERDILKKMKSKDPFVYGSLEEKMNQYVNNPIENAQKLQILKKVKSQSYMWELVFSLSKSEIRFLGCLAQETDNHTFYALVGFRKKDQEIKSKYTKIAKSRISEFISYYHQNELQKLL